MHSPLKRTLLCFLLVPIISCAGVNKFFNGPPDPTDDHEAINRKYASSEPTTAEGAMKMSKEDEDLNREMQKWGRTLSRHGYKHNDPPVQNLRMASERFNVKVGDRLADKRQSTRLIAHMLRGSEAVRDAILRFSPQIIATVQDEAKDAGSYRRTGGPNRFNKGNCVVSTRPFGKEGTQNQGLLFRLTNEELLHARCYLVIPRKEIGKNPRLTVWIDTALIAEIRNNDVRKLRGGDRYVDLILKIAKSPLYRTNGKKIPSNGTIVPLRLKGEWDSLGTHREHDNVTGTSVQQNQQRTVLADTAIWLDVE